MDFAPLEGIRFLKLKTVLITVLGIALTLPGFLVPDLLSEGLAKEDVITPGMMLATPAFLIGGLLALLGPMGTPEFLRWKAANRRADRLRSELSRKHGIELTEYQFSKLKYPLSRPAPVAQSYGTVTYHSRNIEDSGYEERRLTLLWDGSKMGYSDQLLRGESTELQPRAEPVN
jgi:hypothetical protein